MEEFVAAAIEAGFTDWGFSPHSPLPMLANAPWALSSSDVDTYINSVNRLKEQYGDKIRLLAGMEIDYIDSSYNPSTEYFQSLPLDYRIGSVHLLKSPRDGSLLDIDCDIDSFSRTVKRHFAGSLQKIVEAYYTAQLELVECGGFDFIAHSDKISSNVRALSSRIMEKEWYVALVENFFDRCVERDVVVEINTKLFERRGVFYPDRKYFELMVERGVVVIINSDAHRIEYMTSGLREARDLYGGEVITL